MPPDGYHLRSSLVYTLLHASASQISAEVSALVTTKIQRLASQEFTANALLQDASTKLQASRQVLERHKRRRQKSEETLVSHHQNSNRFTDVAIPYPNHERRKE